VGRADELREQLETSIGAELGRAVAVEDLGRVAGGSSRETWSFMLVDGEEKRRMILRRDPPGAQRGSDKGLEVEVLRRSAAAGVPVPEVLWTVDGGFVMPFIDGETIGRRIVRDDAFARARPKMAAQVGEIAARIHSVPTDGLPLAAPDGSPALSTLEQYRSVMDSVGEAHPAFELGFRWLERTAPAGGRTTLVHGDFRNGNFIVGPDGIRAVLDWELVHLGDPWEDLAWVCVRSWRFGAPGPVGGFGDYDDLFAAYERTAGVPVDRDAVRWWEAMGTLKWGVMTMMQAFTHLWGHVRSLDLAAIGRRTVECEYDLINIIRGR
jgi:aminoglycoside phosphotransferase (APT) family kinase protein